MPDLTDGEERLEEVFVPAVFLSVIGEHVLDFSAVFIERQKAIVEHVDRGRQNLDR